MKTREEKIEAMKTTLNILIQQYHEGKHDSDFKTQIEKTKETLEKLLKLEVSKLALYGSLTDINK